jgi:uncharacterized protein (DUF1501 family)
MATMSRFLQARRLVEAGARFVTCSFAHFDWHGKNFESARKVVPLLDQGVAALVDDLYERGLEKDVTVLVWGEFGRTPKINKAQGRDHWGACQSVVLAGGGVRGGQVYGSSDAHAAYPKTNPVAPEDVIATMYHALGISPESTIHDRENRPHRISEGRALVELFG